MKRVLTVIAVLLLLAWPAAVMLVNRLVTVPALPLVTAVRQADQHWSPAVSRSFHHAALGSVLLPYAWLLALEQPALSWTILGEVPRFLDDAYISRFGFLPDGADPVHNPDGLPIGLARDDRWVNPATGEKRLMAGLTCAACHTGQLEYPAHDGTTQALRIEGGAGMIDLQRFEQAMGIAVELTDRVPGRFGRFARRVLGTGYSEAAALTLRDELSAFVAEDARDRALNTQYAVYPHQPGYGRVDALNRTGNQVLGLSVQASNLAPADAPVAFPHLWGASWFDSGRSNGSVTQPLVRNVGEALGVRAPFVGRGPAAGLYRSAVHVDTLRDLETWLSGPAPYQGLMAPRWPEAALGRIDRDLAAKGAALYGAYCARCHLPPTEELAQDRETPEPRYWTATNVRGDRLLRLHLVTLADIGTDPRQAKAFAERTADTADLGLGTILAGVALDQVSTAVIRRYFAEHHIPEDQQLSWNQGHELGARGARVALAYKARPLDGVWATPPFLHNGSVPSLYDLLVPVEKRPVTFTLGRRQFDARKVGYQTDAVPGIDAFDTTLRGNSNAGHEFADRPGQRGVIGPLLTDDQRRALVEYLKTR